MKRRAREAALFLSAGMPKAKTAVGAWIFGSAVVLVALGIYHKRALALKAGAALQPGGKREALVRS